jgi:hypothetical protein
MARFSQRFQPRHARSMVQDWQMSTDIIHNRQTVNADLLVAVVMALGRTRAAHGPVEFATAIVREGHLQVLLVADCSRVDQVPGPVSAGRAGGRNW